MTNPRSEGWYRASGPRATFAFRISEGKVVEVAPYGRRWLLGRPWAEAWEKLYALDYEMARLREPSGLPSHKHDFRSGERCSICGERIFPP